MSGYRGGREQEYGKRYYPFAGHFPLSNSYMGCFNPWPYSFQANYPYYNGHLSGPLTPPFEQRSLSINPPQVQQPRVEDAPRSSSSLVSVVPLVKIEDNASGPVSQASIKKPQRKSDKCRQKYGRNILSNIFHMAIKTILSEHFNFLIQKTIKSHKMVISEAEFLSKLHERSRNLHTYVSMKSLQKVLVGTVTNCSEFDREYRLLLRVAMIHYIQYEHIPHIYASGKIKKESRVLHLDSVRKLAQQLGRS